MTEHAKTRLEHDALGPLEVPADRYWGAQTERARRNFPIGRETMPEAQLRALLAVKEAAAIANKKLGTLDAARAEAIVAVCQALRGEAWDPGDFPLSLWQSGSGTQTNMNVNEVVAHRAAERSGLDIHPNDHVNRSQSTNDVFPTAMHIAVCLEIRDRLIPALREATRVLDEKADTYRDVIKVGRTHLQDATPLTVGQEISAWAEMLRRDEERIQQMLLSCRQLALGGTAVGTGLNAPAYFDECAVDVLAERLHYPFETTANKFYALTSRAPLLGVHGALNVLAADLMKIANDVRWAASGPRAGLGEYRIPANEPGSSIMPGKINPTQAEALTMVCVQVMGHETAVTVAASQGNFQLNVYAPLIIHNVLNSVELLADGLASFTARTLEGLTVDEEKVEAGMRHSLMLVTALSPHIGYERAAKIALHAHRRGIGLKEAALDLGEVTAEDFDRWVKPEAMLHPDGWEPPATTAPGDASGNA